MAVHTTTWKDAAAGSLYIGQSSLVVSTIGIGDTSLCLLTCNTYTFTRETDCRLQVYVMLDCRWLRRRASRKHREHWRKLPMWFLSHRQHCSFAIYSHSTWSPQRRIRPSSFRCRWTSYALSLANDAATCVWRRQHVVSPNRTVDAADADVKIDGGGDHDEEDVEAF